MPYTRVTRAKNGAEAIQYARGGNAGHGRSGHRNEYITGINLFPDSVVPFERQMQPFWDKADPRHKVQIDRYIISYSPEELNSKNPEDVLKGHEISCELARTMAPGHQIAVFTQVDGKGGKIHSHFLVNDVNMATHKGLQPSRYWFPTLKSESLKICGKYFNVAGSKRAREMETRTERGRRTKNEKVKIQNAQEVEAAQAEGRAPVLLPEAYIWKEDLKRRIRAAAEASSSEDEFFRELTARGVDAEKRKATKKQPAHYLYELTDITGFSGKVPQNLKAKSFKLGEDYQPLGVAAMSKAASYSKFVDPSDPGVHRGILAYIEQKTAQMEAGPQSDADADPSAAGIPVPKPEEKSAGNQVQAVNADAPQKTEALELAERMRERIHDQRVAMAQEIFRDFDSGDDDDWQPGNWPPRRRKR